MYMKQLNRATESPLCPSTTVASAFKFLYYQELCDLDIRYSAVSLDAILHFTKLSSHTCRNPSLNTRLAVDLLIFCRILTRFE